MNFTGPELSKLEPYLNKIRINHTWPELFSDHWEVDRTRPKYNIIKFWWKIYIKTSGHVDQPEFDQSDPVLPYSDPTRPEIRVIKVDPNSTWIWISQTHSSYFGQTGWPEFNLNQDLSNTFPKSQIRYGFESSNRVSIAGSNNNCIAREIKRGKQPPGWTGTTKLLWAYITICFVCWNLSRTPFRLYY